MSFALRAAARKHNVTVDGLAALAENLRGQLAEIEGGETKLAALRKAVDEAASAYLAHARALSQARIKAAAKLDQEVKKELKPLKLDKASFKTNVDVLPEEQGGPDGIDRVSFLVSTNPGAPLGGLIKIASGGECRAGDCRYPFAAGGGAGAPPFPYLEGWCEIRENRYQR